ERDDRDQDRANVVVVEALECGEQRAADPARADDADHRRIAQIAVELVGRETNEPRKDLRQHAIGQYGYKRSSGGANRLDLLVRDFLDRLREELADEAERFDR